MDGESASSLYARLKTEGVAFSITTTGRLRLAPWKFLPEDDQRAVHRVWGDLLAIVRDEKAVSRAPQTPDLAPVTVPPPSLPEPTRQNVVRVRGYKPHTVDERDVLEAVADLGDEMVADYRNGKLSKARAYAMGADWVRAHYEMRHVRVGGFWIPYEWIAGR